MKILHLFNPTCELAVDNGDKNYTPPTSLLRFEQDLSLLPLVYAEHDDIVLISGNLSQLEHEYFSWLYGGGVNLIDKNRFVSTCLSDSYALMPWGFAPNIFPVLTRLNQLIGFDLVYSPLGGWLDRYQDFFSRKMAVLFLERAVELRKNLGFAPPFLPKIVGSFEEIYDLVGSGNEFVVKSLWSASGRGVFISKDAKLNPTHVNMISRIFKLGKSVVVEPFFEKVVDFSMQFELDAKLDIIFKGVSLFESDSDGRYVGSKINFSLDDFCVQHVELFRNVSLDKLAVEVIAVLHKLLSDVEFSPFAAKKFSPDFSFPFGVDMMIYSDKVGNERLHPCIEINWRRTMGNVALSLSERVDKDFVGTLIVGPVVDWQFRCNEAVKQFDFSGTPFSSSGFYPLTSWCNDAAFGAFLQLVPR